MRMNGIQHWAHTDNVPYSLMRSAPRPGLQYENRVCQMETTVFWTNGKWEESRFLEAKKKNQIVFRKDTRGKWCIEYKRYLKQ